MNRGLWILKFMVFGIAALVLIGWLTQTLWNWLVPFIFHGPELSFWQALGVLALSKILFWSFGRGGSRRWHYRGGPWNRAWAAKWESMSPEDREKYKQRMMEKWCYPEKTASATESDPSKA